MITTGILCVSYDTKLHRTISYLIDMKYYWSAVYCRYSRQSKVIMIFNNN